VDGVRPILATTKSIETAKRYMGRECCFFEIQVAPGIRYIDTNNLFTFPDRDTGELVTNVSNEAIDKLLALAESMPNSFWLKKAILRGTGRWVVRTLFLQRVRDEEEVMIDGTQGGFTVTPHMFKARYTTKGRGRTLRRTSNRRSKNGRRSTRKSQDFGRRRP
jgi:hypothetical protein